MMLRAALLLIAFLSFFLFPWQVSVALLFSASLLIPPAGLLLGIIGDLVYYVPGASLLPFLTLWGACATAFALLVHRFVKTRSIGE
ncbi:MAG: hypothetical protein V4644_02985 [Patescibacteria group bacterium]